MNDPILECPRCGQRSTFTQAPNACPNCKSDYLEVHYDLDAIKRDALPRWPERPFSLWRYAELLPLRNPDNIITLGEGGTPLLRPINVGTRLAPDHINTKDQRQGP
ncbi:MAG: hypothetical protein KA765_16160, partial [Thermoflexales bacterium]|nr:hypothetical protein [Thermoflexales bacterium]